METNLQELRDEAVLELEVLAYCRRSGACQVHRRYRPAGCIRAKILIISIIMTN